MIQLYSSSLFPPSIKTFLTTNKESCKYKVVPLCLKFTIMITLLEETEALQKTMAQIVVDFWDRHQ